MNEPTTVNKESAQENDVGEMGRKRLASTNADSGKPSKGLAVGGKESNLSHVSPQNSANDISEEEESDSLRSDGYEEEADRKRDIVQGLRAECEPENSILSIHSNPSTALSKTSIISGLSTISHNRRQAHIASEQKRRQSINEGFEDLRRAVPTCSNSSDSKAVILRKAVNYINQLQNEMARLKAIVGGSPVQSSPPVQMYPQHMQSIHYPYHHMGHVNPPLPVEHGIPGRHSPVPLSYVSPGGISRGHPAHPSQMHLIQQPGLIYGHGGGIATQYMPPGGGLSNMSYPVGYNQVAGPGYGHVHNVQLRPMQPHPNSLLPVLPQPPLPPLKQSPRLDYNREDYVSAASLSMLRHETSITNKGSSDEKH